jgi:hypothetical protein
MTGRFEWHITCPKKHAAEVKKIADELGFVYSQITGCPILGQGTYCYITGYNTEAGDTMNDVAKTTAALVGSKIPVLRAKVEDIVYDTKTHVDRLTGRAQVRIAQLAAEAEAIMRRQ